jgi:enediyne biosynthesis protein E4
MIKNYKYILFLFGIVLASCKDSKTVFGNSDMLFATLGTETGIDFQNTVENTDEMNIFNYRNFYNGAGVAVGDINNDGLADIYFVRNQGDNKLYLNKGNWKFEDITAKAGVAGKHAFSTGAVMADVNGDGLLDIYVCNSGELKTDDRANELFINNGKLGFTESAAAYGLDDKGYSSHAAFFDYDIDGDLDMFLLQNSSFPVNKLANKNIRNERDPLAGQKLFRNDDGKFKDVSAETGIFGSLIGFGLGITIGDFNNDHFPDIYISNDFYERDYLYMNTRAGGFKEELTQQMGHLSMSSMGADVADINNDDQLDIFSTDMLPWDDYRLKTTMLYEDINLYNLKQESDFYHQYSRNMLQINNGNGSFSEVGALAGVHATDWSWGALIFDMDTDGEKDLFVANGIYKNVTDQDFVQFLNEESTLQPYKDGQRKFNYKDFMDKMAVTPISNYAFKNKGDLQFDNQASNWGLGTPSFSSGAAYGDLDNDGDLDLITNNTNQPAGIFRNQSVEKNKTNFLKVKLIGNLKNTKGIGARVKLYADKGLQVLEQMPNRGFESSVDYVLNFGLGKKTKIDSVLVIWPGGKSQKLIKVSANTTLEVKEVDADSEKAFEQFKFADFDITNLKNFNYTHQENYFVDYDRDGLLKQMYSREGPGLAVADVDGNGTEDSFIGAGTGFASKLMMQGNNGKFTENNINTSNLADIVDASFFDADGDKDLDLLLVTGGNDALPDQEELKDVLMLNDGKGNFVISTTFPIISQVGSSAATFDFEGDGDLDVFIAGRLRPFQYGIAPKHVLLINDGKANFKENTNALPTEGLGMITDVRAVNLRKGKLMDLVAVQDWGGIMTLQNDGKTLKTKEVPNTQGWWNTIAMKDLDADGDMDFVVGNMGTNTRFKTSEAVPASLIVKDFDNNLRMDHIYECLSEDGKAYPMVLKTDLQKQIPSIKKQFLYFKDFGKKTAADIFGDAMKGAVKLDVKEGRSGVLINENGNLTFKPLPVQAQFAPVYGIETLDYNGDSLPDLFLTGNYFDTQTELGRYDANYGQIFINKGKGEFSFVPFTQNKIRINGQVRNSRKIAIKGIKNAIILAKNSDKAQLIQL